MSTTRAAEPQGTAPVDAEAALCEVGSVASQRTADELGRPDGFYLRPAYHIPLPTLLDDAAKRLRKGYEESLVDALERAINRAAEDTARSAGTYIAKSMECLVFAEPKRFLTGPPNSIALALRRQLGPALRDAIRPTLVNNLEKEGEPEALRKFEARYEQIANAALPRIDLTAYALDGFMNSFFACIADQEQAMRAQPSARPTDAIRQIFSTP